MKIQIVSDTHNKFNHIVPYLEPADVLIHCGDFGSAGRLNEIEKFNRDLAHIKHLYKNILVIPGNHDEAVETDKVMAKSILTNATLLVNEEIVIDGVKFYGSPYTPEFGRWAFMLPRGSDEMKANWDMIPDDVNVLITHGPPYGILDWVRDGLHAGCELLLERVLQLKHLKMHFSGHLHEGNGIEDLYGIKFINASIMDEYYRPVNKPYMVEI